MSVKDSINNLILPPGYLYTVKHIWLQTEDPDRRFSLVGVTEIVSRRFRSVREVQLPDDIIKARRGEVIGRITGLGAFDGELITIPVHCPVSGIINPPNEVFFSRFLRRAKPELILTDPYDEGWLVGLLAESRAEIDDLMDPKGYRDYLKQLTRNDATALYRFSETDLTAANPTRSKGIFISYRRADSSDWAQRLAQRMERYHGSADIYLDIASIRPGKDYRKAIRHHLDKVDIVVVIIGTEFFSIRNDSGQVRFAIEDDPVRIELREALRLGKIICPVLVDGAAEPRDEDFPEELREVAFLQRFRIDSDNDLNEFVTSLRPDILLAEPADHYPDRQEVSGGWDLWRETEADYPRQRTALIQQLIELGWLMDPRVGEGNLSNPDFPQYRIRFDELMVWLDMRQRGFFGRTRWDAVQAFPVFGGAGSKPLSLPTNLKLAATNPDAFLSEGGRF